MQITLAWSHQNRVSLLICYQVPGNFVWAFISDYHDSCFNFSDSCCGMAAMSFLLSFLLSTVGESFPFLGTLMRSIVWVLFWTLSTVSSTVSIITAVTHLCDCNNPCTKDQEVCVNGPAQGSQPICKIGNPSSGNAFTVVFEENETEKSFREVRIEQAHSV